MAGNFENVMYNEHILYLFYIILCSKFYTPYSKVVGSNSVHDKVYSILHYLIKFVSALPPVKDILRGGKFNVLLERAQQRRDKNYKHAFIVNR